MTQIASATARKFYAGVDASLKETAVCIVDDVAMSNADHSSLFPASPTSRVPSDLSDMAKVEATA